MKICCNNLCPKVMVWDYYSMTKESHLALSRSEKEKMIKNYYSEIIKRPSDEKIFFIFQLGMSRHKSRKTREEVKQILIDTKEKVIKPCSYCGSCKLCEMHQFHCAELKEKGFNTKSQTVHLWKITFRGKYKHFTLTSRP